MPWKTGFIENLDNNPDLYGPFWLITTLIFLLSSTGNFARYFANFFTKSDYLFNLALVQQGVIVMYSFGFGFPTALYFIMKLLGCNRLRLPEVLFCEYAGNMPLWVFFQLLCDNLSAVYNSSQSTPMDFHRIWDGEHYCIFNFQFESLRG